MKKIYKFNLFMLLIAFAFSTQAQVVNGNFETIKPNGKVSNWGINFSIPVSIDLNTGQNISDFVLFDNYIDFSCSPTDEAHTGLKALDIRNAYNVTTDSVIPGGAMIFNDATQDSPGWNFGVPIEAGVEINYLAFYYKFLPFGLTDVVQAELTVHGESGEIGKAIILISETKTDFTYVYAPVEFTSNETPLLMTIAFSMQAEGSIASFGTRFIVDDVSVNNSILKTNTFESQNFTIYPTITNQEINILKYKTLNEGTYHFKIYNTTGSIIQENNLTLESGVASKIDVSQLASGLYLLKSDNTNFVKKFIKK